MSAEEINQPQPEKEQQKAAAEKPAQNKTAEAKPTQTQSAEQAKPGAEAKPKAEKQTNCPVCNKSIKRLTRYYRDGKFYCSKKCWRATKEKAKKEKEAPKK